MEADGKKPRQSTPPTEARQRKLRFDAPHPRRLPPPHYLSGSRPKGGGS
jgi:hypothetical protein